MQKCGNIDEAVEVFAEAAVEASSPDYSFAEKGNLIFDALRKIRDEMNIRDEATIQALEEQIDIIIEEGGLQSVAADYRKVFKDDFDFDKAEARRSTVHGEEGDSSKIERKVKTRMKFLKDNFKDAGEYGAIAARPMLYFQREARHKLLETFIIDRNHGKLVEEEDIPRNVREFKQRLLDTIIDYLNTFGYHSQGNDLLFDRGKYTGILDKGTVLRTIIDAKLTFGSSFDANFLKNTYNTFRKQKTGYEKAQKFLEAYNAKVMLENFDALTTILLGEIIVPVGINCDTISNTEYELKIHKATNMWGNGYGDEVADIADVVSEVTQKIIQTSRKYNWKGEAMPDQYLTFSDFNSILTKIKDLTYSTDANKILLDTTFFNEEGNNVELTSTTHRTLDAITKLKQSQKLNEPVTFSDILAFISDNPQRHLHAIFDLLCKTNIVDKLPTITEQDKNLIWSVGKEIFGSWNDTDAQGKPIPSRSLFDLHENSNNDRIFEIITQMADSLFAEKFLQYYEDFEGSIKMRVLQDYELSRVKNQLLYRMKQTHGIYDPTRFSRYQQNYGIKIEYAKPKSIYTEGRAHSTWMIKNPNYNEKDSKSVQNIPLKAEFLKKITIPIADGKLLIECTGKGIRDFIPGETIFTKDLESIWKSTSFRNFINDTIGIDFNTDVELASAYEQGFRSIDASGKVQINYNNLVYDISRLCGQVAFNQAFNNIIVPTVLNNGIRDRNRPNISILTQMQYVNEVPPRINSETGVVEMLADNVKDSYLAKLSLAQAITHGLLTSAVIKTGEGTNLANQGLSCLRSNRAYQIMTQNKNVDSATRHLTFVNNKNGFYQGVLTNREFKTNNATKTTTKLSAKETFKLNFLGFVGAYVESSDSTTLNRNGNAFMAPTVNSDKPAQNLLATQLQALSQWTNKRYADMSIDELNQEMQYEFGKMYDVIITNINTDNTKLAKLVGADISGISSKYSVKNYPEILQAIEKAICDDDTLLDLVAGKDSELDSEINLLKSQGSSSTEIINEIKKNCVKKDQETYEEEKFRKKYEDFRKKLAKTKEDRITKQIHQVVTNYNRTHRCHPIETCLQIHYLFDKDGNLVPNDVLKALWGRFQGNEQLNKGLGITDLYPNLHKDASTCEGYFKYEKDFQMAEELLEEGFEVFLYGTKSRKSQEELEYLRKNFPQWITDSGKMAIARIFIPNSKYNIGDSFIRENTTCTITNILVAPDGIKTYEIHKTGPNIDEYFQATEGSCDLTVKNENVKFIPAKNRAGKYEIINDLTTFKNYRNDLYFRENLEIHPMLSRVNRMYYLTTQQYTASVGGAHYVYKGKGADVLEEEAQRWLASNKRNVSYGSTKHAYQNKTLTGVPKRYQIAPIEDIKSDIYSVFGDLDSHKPIDGGMFVHPCFAILENNSLGGEAAGIDKKQFGVYYYDRLAAGGIIKTAGFAGTNQRMMRSEAYRALCKNMMHRSWIKEFPDINGQDIEEKLDITRDYNGNIINWVRDAKGCYTCYARETADKGFRRFRLDKIEAIYTNEAGEERSFEGEVPIGWTPTNKYRIYEFPINAQGEIDANDPVIRAQLQNNQDIHSIQRTFGADANGEFTINNNWDFFTLVFGGYNSLSLNSEGILKPSENSIVQLTNALNSIGYKRDVEHNDSRFGDERYDIEFIDKVKDQDDLWQPLKYSDICYAPNIGALKSTQMNVNPKEAMYTETYLNAMNIMMAQLGIQLDKEHHADNSELSMPTQIISACANKGYTIQRTDKLYKALSSLTELAIEDCMTGIMEMMPGHENKGTLLTQVATIIVDKLIQSKDDNAALEAALSHLLEIRNQGKKLHPEDVVGKVAWSDAKFYNKVYSDLSSHLTNTAVKMKFPGSLAVICPTEKMEQMYGNRRLNTFANPDQNLSEQAALAIYQDEVRTGKYPDKLIYDSNRDGDNIQHKLSMASGIDTQHHYTVEFTYSDGSPVVGLNEVPYTETYTINTPNDYYKLKELLAYGRGPGKLKIGNQELDHQGLKVSKVYENVTKGRELGAYNVRFQATNGTEVSKFNMFDLASIQQLFAYEDYPKTLEQANALLNDKLFIGDKRGEALNIIIRVLYRDHPKSYNTFLKYINANKDTDMMDVIPMIEDARIKDDIVDAVFQVCKAYTRKQAQQDLFCLSPDYKGQRNVVINTKPWDDHPMIYQVIPDTIKTQAYELIMPKLYQTRFGLEEQDQVQDILADPDFFTKRAINKIKNHRIAEENFHYELKSFNGQHIYIWDSRLGQPDPEVFEDKKFYKFQTERGKWERRDLDGNVLYGLSSDKDKIMTTGKLGYEVIVTDNPQYYLENMHYNLLAFSNLTIKEENLQTMVDGLKTSDSRNAKKALRVLTDKDGKLRDFKNLQARNEAFKHLSLIQEEGEPYEVRRMRNEFIKEGRELHASFDKSLDIIAGRIPAQSQQSFMPQRVVAFDNNDINTAYVSTFQLFLQGSRQNLI